MLSKQYGRGTGIFRVDMLPDIFKELCSFEVGSNGLGGSLMASALVSTPKSILKQTSHIAMACNRHEERFRKMEGSSSRSQVKLSVIMLKESGRR